MDMMSDLSHRNNNKYNGEIVSDRSKMKITEYTDTLMDDPSDDDNNRCTCKEKALVEDHRVKTFTPDELIFNCDYTKDALWRTYEKTDKSHSEYANPANEMFTLFFNSALEQY